MLAKRQQVCRREHRSSSSRRFGSIAQRSSRGPSVPTRPLCYTPSVMNWALRPSRPFQRVAPASERCRTPSSHWNNRPDTLSGNLFGIRRECRRGDRRTSLDLSLRYPIIAEIPVTPRDDTPPPLRRAGNVGVVSFNIGVSEVRLYPARDFL